MTAALASMGPIGWACAAAGAWIVLALGVGRGIGAAIVQADEAMEHGPVPPLSAGDVDFINVIPADAQMPPVPVRDADAEWLATWPADTPVSVIEAAYYDKEFLAIPEVAADMRWAS